MPSTRQILKNSGQVLNKRPILWFLFMIPALLNNLSLGFQEFAQADTFTWVLPYAFTAILGTIFYGGAIYALHDVLYEQNTPTSVVLSRFAESSFFYSGKLIAFGLAAGAGLTLVGIANIAIYGTGSLLYVFAQPFFIVWPFMILSYGSFFGAARSSLSITANLYPILFVLSVISFLMDAGLAVAADALYSTANRLVSGDIPETHYMKLLFCFPQGIWLCLRSGIVILAVETLQERQRRE